MGIRMISSGPFVCCDGFDKEKVFLGSYFRRVMLYLLFILEG